MTIDPAAAETFTKGLAHVFTGAGILASWGDEQGLPQALGLSAEEWAQNRLVRPMKLTLGERRRASWVLTAPKEAGGQGMSTRLTRRPR